MLHTVAGRSTGPWIELAKRAAWWVLTSFASACGLKASLCWLNNMVRLMYRATNCSDKWQTCLEICGVGFFILSSQKISASERIHEYETILRHISIVGKRLMMFRQRCCTVHGIFETNLVLVCSQNEATPRGRLLAYNLELFFTTRCFGS